MRAYIAWLSLAFSCLGIGAAFAQQSTTVQLPSGRTVDYVVKSIDHVVMQET